MLTLNDGRKELYQWDTGRTATVDIECDVVHFSNLKYGESLAVEVKAGVVSIPNKLLMIGEQIYCWAFVADVNGNYTKQEQTLNVNKRAKPSDYVYTETETLTWKSLDERITELEKGGPGGSGVSIDDTLTISGAAADAKAVGDQIRALSDEMLIEESDPTVPAWAKEPTKPVYTASEVGAEPSGTAASMVSAHNTGADTHSDIRVLISGLTDRLNALADSDDTTLDQLSEIVAYIKSNKSLIDAITTNKVSVSDIVDNLTTNATNKPLSAAQGKALKALIDAITIPEALPNPNALTFTGAVTGSYDGSAPLSVEIPSGGLTVINTAAVGQTVRITEVDENGQPAAWEAVEFTSGDVWELLYETTLTENAETFSQEIPACSKVKMVIFPRADVSGWKQIIINGKTYQALNSTMSAVQAYFVSIDTLMPPYITASIGMYNNPSVNGINGGNSSFSYAMINDNITTIGCGTAGMLVTGAIVKIWGVRE